MTEAEWLASGSPRECLLFLNNKITVRKRLLFCCECCRRMWDHLADPRSRLAVVTAERAADDPTLMDECDAALGGADDAYQELTQRADNPSDGRPRYGDFAAEAITHASMAAAYTGYIAAKVIDIRADAAVVATAAANVARYVAARQLPGDGNQNIPNTDVPRQAHRCELGSQAVFLRDIFGNPFRPVAFSPEWRTSTAVALAQGMYESRDFDAMPILADALQDAGCDSDEVLNHCRDPQQVHVRGCWVVDLVLGKE